MKTLIKNGRVVTAIDDYHADIFIGGETVTTIGKTLDVQADVVIDASGKLVIPGGIDPHTHMELPFGGTSRCRWQARSRSCVVAVRAPQYPLAARVAVRIGYQLHSRIAYCVGEYA
jgi:dihydroorotase-like cyclic amidohydrolase